MKLLVVIDFFLLEKHVAEKDNYVINNPEGNFPDEWMAKNNAQNRLYNP